DREPDQRELGDDHHRQPDPAGGEDVHDDTASSSAGSVSRVRASWRRPRSARYPVPRNTTPSSTNSQAPSTIRANTAKLCTVVKSTRPSTARAVNRQLSCSTPRTATRAATTT